VVNATFSNISIISWRSVLLLEETKGHGENHRHVALLSYILTISVQATHKEEKEA
jgi:hypothetical protein